MVTEMWLCVFYWALLSQKARVVVSSHHGRLIFGHSLITRYLLRNLIVCYISFDSKWPFNMKVVLVELQQKNNEHKKGINHYEREYRWVSQFFKIPGNTCLKFGEISNIKVITVRLISRVQYTSSNYFITINCKKIKNYIYIFLFK